MKFFLFRDYITPEASIGRIFNPNDNFSLHTLELPWLDNQPNISCIPDGIYIAERDYYHRGGYEAFELRNVTGRSEIKIHIGNYAKNVKGCIALGMKRDVNVPMIKDSRKAYGKFMDYLDACDRIKIEIRSI